ncbi:guanine nucleotide-binding protein beta SU [Plasmodium falciparum IGH-CR14]|uniref:Guanine nucleotide-binding protein beta SU n=1 Tax=Plasmodium falciparum IGH-CR14 TaxID=580059 RepID=A0A0L1IAI0_PLAFA|nr:guanine nucleotide-binding protein beta SU [Plasmodium falciparum IGH-CR14]
MQQTAFQREGNIKYIKYAGNIIFNNLKGEQLDKKYQCRENVSNLKFPRRKKVRSRSGKWRKLNLIWYVFVMIEIKNFLRDINRQFNDLIFNYHMDNITSLILYNNNDTDYLISSSYDGFIYFYDIIKKKHTNKLEIQEPIECIYIFEKEYLILSVRNVIKFYSITNFKYIKDIVISTKTIFYINSFKKYIVASSLDMSIYFIDPFYKNTEEIKIVCIVNYSNHPKSFEIYNDIIALGEIDGTWSIELYHKKEKLHKNKKKSKFNKIYYEDEKICLY